jgi:GH15 family glucan-1,4-alpha-glucosidase
LPIQEDETALAIVALWHPWVGPDGERQLPIQEDETALAIVALWHHWQRFHDVEMIRPLYSALVKPAAEFLLTFRDPRTGLPLPSYDLWEERRGITAFAAGAVWAGLKAAAGFVEAFGEESLANKYQNAAAEVRAGALAHLYCKREKRFLRSINIECHGGIESDYTLDSSLYGLFAFGMLGAAHPWVAASMKAVEERLWCHTPIGGMARYEGDPYWQVSQDSNHVPGNPWIICTLWLADWYIQKASTIEELKTARDLLCWVQSRALPGGALPEQLNPYTGEPIGASPLTWSHATAALTIHRYAQKYRELEGQEPRRNGTREGKRLVGASSRHSAS